VSKHLTTFSTTKLIILISAAVIVYFLVVAGIGAVRSYQLHQREGSLRSELQELHARYDRLQALKDYLNSDEFIESAAREQLGLVREGETGFVAISSQPAPTPAPNDPHPELWWDILIR
jgi:cell division protein FtsB